MAFAGETIPEGYLLCDGQSTSGYATLENIFGSNVPDLTNQILGGRNPNDRDVDGCGDNFNVNLLESIGSNEAVLTDLPKHRHELDITNFPNDDNWVRVIWSGRGNNGQWGTFKESSSGVWASTCKYHSNCGSWDIQLANKTSKNLNDGNEPFDISQPYLKLNYIVKI